MTVGRGRRWGGGWWPGGDGVEGRSGRSVAPVPRLSNQVAITKSRERGIRGEEEITKVLSEGKILILNK